MTNNNINIREYTKYLSLIHIHDIMIRSSTKIDLNNSFSEALNPNDNKLIIYKNLQNET